MHKVYLLDTNIVSEFSKEKPNKMVTDLYEMRKGLCAISAITWQELNHGVSRMPEGKRKNYISSCLEFYKEFLEIIPYDNFAASICGEMQAYAEKDGKTLPYSDSQIAATAISNGMILVTRNTSVFSFIADRTFLKMEDWFEG